MSTAAAIVIFFSSLSLQSCPEFKGVDVVGFAYDVRQVEKSLKLASDRALLPRYCEYHRFSDEGAHVEYRQIDKLPIAEKKIIFQNENKFTPELIQRDFRFDERRIVTLSDGDWQVQYLGPQQKKEKNRVVDFADVDIVDLGFDFAIKEKWSSLMAGEQLSFSFLSVPHLRPITLKTFKQPLEKCTGAMEHDGLVCFWVEPTSALLRWVTSPLKLTYDMGSRRLMMFEGAANILDKDKKTSEVLIVYRYRDELESL